MKNILLVILLPQLVICQNQWMLKSISEEPIFETKQLFFEERMPNVVVATDGSIIASFGKTKFMVKRSKDNGKSWEPYKIKIIPDKNGIIPSMHMNEHGITLRKGKYKGRLIRPSRYYNVESSSKRKWMYSNAKEKLWKEQYTNAIFSEDGGYTWFTSEPFPANGTGEAALVELNDGSLYYNSRRHFYNDGNNHRMRLAASSNDGGETWDNMDISNELPDGPKNLDYGLMAGLDRLPHNEQDILIFSNVDSKNERENGMIWISFDGGKTWPLKKSIDQGKYKYSSIAVGRENTPSEGFIYVLYEFGDFQNNYAGAKIAKFNMSWLLLGKDIYKYVK